MNSKMKIAMWYGPLDLRIDEIDIPTPAEGELLIEVKVALTCGTDVKIYKRGYPKIQPPHSLGHEFSGVVAKVGPGVDESLIGKRVVTSNSGVCNYCFYCKRGQSNLCESMGVIYGGAYAKYIAVPATIVRQNLHVLPDSMSYEDAAMVEPLCCAIHGVNVSGADVGTTVAVIGAGPLGLLILQVAKMKGARVISIDKSAQRLKKAQELGADAVILAGSDVLEQTKTQCEGRGPDIVIEAVGLKETWEQAIDMVRKGGTVVEFGGCASGTVISVDARRLHYDEITIKGAFHAVPREIEQAYQLVAEGRIKSADYISGKFPLEKVKEALDLHMRQAGIKYAVYP